MLLPTFPLPKETSLPRTRSFPRTWSLPNPEQLKSAPSASRRPGCLVRYALETKFVPRGHGNFWNPANRTGSEMPTLRMNGPVISGHQLFVGKPRASPGSERDETEGRAKVEGGLRLGPARLLRSPSRCRAYATRAQKGSRGLPRGCFS